MIKKVTVSEIQKLLGYEIEIVAENTRKSLGEIPVGTTCYIGGVEFIVLEHDEDSESTFVITKDFITIAPFDENTNDFKNSSLFKKELLDFYLKIKRVQDGVFSHIVNLTSDDGRKDYGYCDAYVSLLTCDQYRKYVHILDKYRPNGLWWLATAFSTSSNGYSRYIRCVDDGGALHYSICYCNRGVRPVCIFDSSILISE